MTTLWQISEWTWLCPDNLQLIEVNPPATKGGAIGVRLVYGGGTMTVTDQGQVEAIMGFLVQGKVDTARAKMLRRAAK